MAQLPNRKVSKRGLPFFAPPGTPKANPSCFYAWQGWWISTHCMSHESWNLESNPILSGREGGVARKPQISPYIQNRVGRLKPTRFPSPSTAMSTPSNHEKSRLPGHLKTQVYLLQKPSKNVGFGPKTVYWLRILLTQIWKRWVYWPEHEKVSQRDPPTIIWDQTDQVIDIQNEQKPCFKRVCPFLEEFDHLKRTLFSKLPTFHRILVGE